MMNIKYKALLFLMLLSLFVLSSCSKSSETFVYVNRDMTPYEEHFGNDLAASFSEYVSPQSYFFEKNGVRVTLDRVISDKHINYAVITAEPVDEKIEKLISIEAGSSYAKPGTPEASNCEGTLRLTATNPIWSSEDTEENGAIISLLETHTNYYFGYTKAKVTVEVKYKDGVNKKVIVPIVIPYNDAALMKEGHDSDEKVIAEVSPVGLWIVTKQAETDEHEVAFKMSTGEIVPVEIDQFCPGYMYSHFYNIVDVNKVDAIVIDGATVSLAEVK